MTTLPAYVQSWKEVRHDNTVTWLAYWKDTVSEKDYKYVWLAANSTFKADSKLKVGLLSASSILWAACAAGPSAADLPPQ